MSDTDEPQECHHCKGSGQKLARLTQEQDYEFAKRGQSIPKVDCWYCNGTGVQTLSEVTVRGQRDEWR